MRARALFTSGLVFLLCAAVLGSGCAPPYVRAQREYWKGDPHSARKILEPEVEKNKKKNTINKNLYFWDMGVYCFSSADYQCALDMFRESVKTYEEIHDLKQTAKSVFTSATKQRYAGDPVEISMAWLFMGLSYHRLENRSNELVALRRSLEEDICKDADCQGNMVVTNFLLGEHYLRLQEFDNAAVAFRRSIELNPELVSAYVGLHQALKAQGRVSDADMVMAQLGEKVDPSYLAEIERADGQGLLIIMYSERCPSVTSDAFLGAFRKRSSVPTLASSWHVSADGPEGGTYQMVIADMISTHLSEQGGFGQEVKQQVTRAVASNAMKQIPCVGLFAPDTSADIRYWVTMPGYFHVGYVPLQAGEYNVKITAADRRGRNISAYAKDWSSVAVGNGVRPLVFASGYVPGAF